MKLINKSEIDNNEVKLVTVMDDIRVYEALDENILYFTNKKDEAFKRLHVSTECNAEISMLWA